MSRATAPLAPSIDLNTYIVLDEFDEFRVYREVEEADANRDDVIQQISEGQFNRPIRIVSFNAAEGWSRDVTQEIAREMIDRGLRAGETLSPSAVEFIDRVIDEHIPAVLIED
jgi:hypothetical protein